MKKDLGTFTNAHSSSLAESFDYTNKCANNKAPDASSWHNSLDAGLLSEPIWRKRAGQSRADFIAKSRIALKEARESHYWLRLLAATGLARPEAIDPLVREANEVVAILTSILRKASPRRT